MSDAGRGLPLLSGPPPSASPESPSACRKCNKEFNFIFIRPRRCNHCGYSYCHSCSDYQALMPRTGNDPSGYDVMPVCGFCIEYLSITAGGKSHLKTLPLAKLKKYVNAYDIKIDRAVEKDDVIERILAVRGPNGCLPRANENYYRRYSVPNRVPPGRPRGLFSRTADAPPPVPPQRPTPGPTFEFARPDLAPDDPPPAPSRDPPYTPRNTRPQPRQPQQPQQRPHYSPPPHPPPRPHSSYSQAPPHPQPPFHTPPPNYSQGYPGQGAHHGPYNPHMPMPQPPPQHTRPQPQQPPPQNHNRRPGPTFPTPQMRSSSPPPPPRRSTTPAPPPDLEQLTTMDTASIKSLSIGALKSVLFTNHVNAGQILEKSDLVEKVLGLVEAERAERERQRLAEEREEMERIAREAERREEEETSRRRAAEQESQSDDDHRGPDRNTTHEDMSGGGGSEGWDDTPIPGSSPPRTAPKANPVPPKAVSHLERTGLCVVCQDEEANIAIVDCGHLAMCRGCSDLIMASSRECPLCRTRIVTEARLLRIFKT